MPTIGIPSSGNGGYLFSFKHWNYRELNLSEKRSQNVPGQRPRTPECNDMHMPPREWRFLGEIKYRENQANHGMGHANPYHPAVIALHTPSA